MKKLKSTKGGFLFVSFEGNKRTASNAKMADAIMIDLDDVNWSIVEMFKKYLEDNNIFAIFYSTSSNTAKVGEDNGSWRIIIFLEEPVVATAYKHLYLDFLEKVGLFKDLNSYDKNNKSLNGVDFSMLSVVQMAFRPTCMKAEDYIFEIWNQEGNFLSYTAEDIFNGEIIESII